MRVRSIWEDWESDYLVDFAEAALPQQALEKVALTQQRATLIAAPLLLLQQPQLSAPTNKLNGAARPTCTPGAINSQQEAAPPSLLGTNTRHDRLADFRTTTPPQYVCIILRFRLT